MGRVHTNKIYNGDSEEIEKPDLTKQQQFIQETREFWEKRTGQPVTDEDAREIIANITGFFKVIAKWDSRVKEKK